MCFFAQMGMWFCPDGSLCCCNSFRKNLNHSPIWETKLVKITCSVYSLFGWQFLFCRSGTCFYISLYVWSWLPNHMHRKNYNSYIKLVPRDYHILMVLGNHTEANSVNSNHTSFYTIDFGTTSRGNLHELSRWMSFLNCCSYLTRLHVVPI